MPGCNPQPGDRDRQELITLPSPRLKMRPAPRYYTPVIRRALPGLCLYQLNTRLLKMNPFSPRHSSVSPAAAAAHHHPHTHPGTPTPRTARAEAAACVPPHPPLPGVSVSPRYAAKCLMPPVGKRSGDGTPLAGVSYRYLQRDCGESGDGAQTTARVRDPGGRPRGNVGRGESPPGEAGPEQGRGGGPAQRRCSNKGFAAVPEPGGAAARSRGGPG